MSTWFTSKNRALTALAIIGLVDSISYMVVSPSLIFYVTQCGGTKEQYGLILSVFSFASFCAKPILGSWTDYSGNKFRLPYLTSITLATIGGLLYFYASVFQDNNARAIRLIMAGRTLGGFGAANSALGFAYLASVVPPDEQTGVNSLLSMTRIIGMAAAPGFNIFLKDIDSTINVGGKFVQLDAQNSVGLFLAGANIMGFLAIYFLLQEPGRKIHVSLHGTLPENYVEGGKWDFIESLFSIEIMLPVFTIFVVNSNFQL